MRKASINFQPVSRIEFAASHAHRTELHEPAYLLPKQHRLANFTVSGSVSEAELVERFHAKKMVMSGQGRARASSPFWEGVMVLPEVSGDRDAYAKRQSARLKKWARGYQKLTGQSVLHIVVHLDEGHIGDDGKPVFNPHAHVFIDRMNAQNRIIKLERKALSSVQDMTAEVMQMQRGQTLAERAGKRGRQHVEHREFRAAAESSRELARVNFHEGYSEGAIVMLDDGERKLQKALETSQRHDWYLTLRGVLKGSGRALQGHYSALKKLYEGSDRATFGSLGKWATENDHLDVDSLLELLDPPAPEKKQLPPPEDFPDNDFGR